MMTEKIADLINEINCLSCTTGSSLEHLRQVESLRKELESDLDSFRGTIAELRRKEDEIEGKINVLKNAPSRERNERIRCLVEELKITTETELGVSEHPCKEQAWRLAGFFAYGRHDFPTIISKFFNYSELLKYTPVSRLRPAKGGRSVSIWHLLKELDDLVPRARASVFHDFDKTVNLFSIELNEFIGTRTEIMAKKKSIDDQVEVLEEAHHAKIQVEIERLWREARNKLEDHLEVTDHPAKEAAWAIAWRQGHELGYPEVAGIFINLVGLMTMPNESELAGGKER